VTATPLGQYNKTYAVLIARVCDIAISSFIWREYDITISAQCGLELRKAAPARWAVYLGAFLNWIEANHCELAIAADLARARAAIALLAPSPAA
jgi:hypothetical protein